MNSLKKRGQSGRKAHDISITVEALQSRLQELEQKTDVLQKKSTALTELHTILSLARRASAGNGKSFRLKADWYSVDVVLERLKNIDAYTPEYALLTDNMLRSTASSTMKSRIDSRLSTIRDFASTIKPDQNECEEAIVQTKLEAYRCQEQLKDAQEKLSWKSYSKAERQLLRKAISTVVYALMEVKELEAKESYERFKLRNRLLDASNLLQDSGSEYLISFGLDVEVIGKACFWEDSFEEAYQAVAQTTSHALALQRTF